MMKIYTQKIKDDSDDENYDFEECWEISHRLPPYTSSICEFCHIKKAVAVWYDSCDPDVEECEACIDCQSERFPVDLETGWPTDYDRDGNKKPLNYDEEKLKGYYRAMGWKPPLPQEIEQKRLERILKEVSTEAVGWTERIEDESLNTIPEEIIELFSVSENTISEAIERGCDERDDRIYLWFLSEQVLRGIGKLRDELEKKNMSSIEMKKLDKGPTDPESLPTADRWYPLPGRPLISVELSDYYDYDLKGAPRDRTSGWCELCRENFSLADEVVLMLPCCGRRICEACFAYDVDIDSEDVLPSLDMHEEDGKCRAYFVDDDDGSHNSTQYIRGIPNSVREMEDALWEHSSRHRRNEWASHILGIYNCSIGVAACRPTSVVDQPSPEVGLEHLRSAASRSYPPSCRALARLYFKGNKRCGVERDLDKARDLLLSSTSEDFRNPLGYLLLAEVCLERKEKYSFLKYCKRAAELGDGKANEALAGFYLKYHNRESAITHFLESARIFDRLHDYEVAAINYYFAASLYREKEHHKKYFEFLVQAADRGHIEAAYLMGSHSLIGLHCVKNIENAQKYLNFASCQGHTVATEVILTRVGFFVSVRLASSDEEPHNIYVKLNDSVGSIIEKMCEVVKSNGGACRKFPLLYIQQNDEEPQPLQYHGENGMRLENHWSLKAFKRRFIFEEVETVFVFDGIMEFYIYVESEANTGKPLAVEVSPSDTIRSAKFKCIRELSSMFQSHKISPTQTDLWLGTKKLFVSDSIAEVGLQVGSKLYLRPKGYVLSKNQKKRERKRLSRLRKKEQEETSAVSIKAGGHIVETR